MCAAPCSVGVASALQHCSPKCLGMDERHLVVGGESGLLALWPLEGIHRMLEVGHGAHVGSGAVGRAVPARSEAGTAVPGGQAGVGLRCMSLSFSACPSLPPPARRSRRKCPSQRRTGAADRTATFLPGERLRWMRAARDCSLAWRTSRTSRPRCPRTLAACRWACSVCLPAACSEPQAELVCSVLT